MGRMRDWVEDEKVIDTCREAQSWEPRTLSSTITSPASRLQDNTFCVLGPGPIWPSYHDSQVHVNMSCHHQLMVHGGKGLDKL